MNSADPTTTQMCDDHAEAIAAHALGEAPLDLAARDHLVTCARCQAMLAEYRAVATGIALTAAAAMPDPAPDAALRGRILAALRSELHREAPAPDAVATLPPIPDTPPPAPRQAPPRQAPPRPPRPLRWPLALLAALLVVSLGFNAALDRQVRQQQTQIAQSQTSWGALVEVLNRPDVARYDLSGAAARGNLWSAPGQTLGCLVAQQLPPAPAGTSYQVWLVDGGRRAHVGAFRTLDDSAWLMVRALQPIQEFSRIEVTLGDDPGAPLILAGSLATPSARGQPARASLAAATRAAP